MKNIYLNIYKTNIANLKKAKKNIENNNVIGIPTETPQLVFDTIELSRSLPDETITGGAYIFIPYHGTPLRQLAIDKKYIDPNLICTESSTTSGSSLLRMSHVASDETDSFMKLIRL